MSRKYYERVLEGTGVRTQKFQSSFGASILKKFGWTEGDGLGKDKSGITDCIQIKRRKENIGLGADTKAAATEWTNWWDALYNTTASSVNLTGSGSSSSDGSDVEETDVRTVSLLDVCEGRTCTRGNLQKGKLRRIEEAERKRQRVPPETPSTEDGVAHADPSSDDVKQKKKKRRCRICSVRVKKRVAVRTDESYTCQQCAEQTPALLPEASSSSLSDPSEVAQEADEPRRKKRRRRAS